jgi:hypothetical protein
MNGAAFASWLIGIVQRLFPTGSGSPVKPPFMISTDFEAKV